MAPSKYLLLVDEICLYPSITTLYLRGKKTFSHSCLSNQQLPCTEAMRMGVVFERKIRQGLGKTIFSLMLKLCLMWILLGVTGYV